MRLREKAAARFEDNLDIRSFVQVYTNLSLILDLLLTKEQKSLFRFNNARAVSLHSHNPTLVDTDDSATDDN